MRSSKRRERSTGGSRPRRADEDAPGGLQPEEHRHEEIHQAERERSPQRRREVVDLEAVHEGGCKHDHERVHDEHEQAQRDDRDRQRELDQDRTDERVGKSESKRAEYSGLPIPYLDPVDQPPYDVEQRRTYQRVDNESHVFTLSAMSHVRGPEYLRPSPLHS